MNRDVVFSSFFTGIFYRTRRLKAVEMFNNSSVDQEDTVLFSTRNECFVLLTKPRLRGDGRLLCGSLGRQ